MDKSNYKLEKAFEGIYHANFTYVFSMARRFVGDVQIAENIASESFMKLWTRMDQIEPPAVRSFLRTTTRNACLNYIRDEKVQSRRRDELAYVLLSEDILQQQQTELTATIFETIIEEINKLSPQLQLVFKLSYFKGMTNEEIANMLGINNQSVRNDKYRAVKALRTSLLKKDIFAYLFFLSWVHP